MSLPPGSLPLSPQVYALRAPGTSISLYLGATASLTLCPPEDGNVFYFHIPSCHFYLLFQGSQPRGSCFLLCPFIPMGYSSTSGAVLGCHNREDPHSIWQVEARVVAEHPTGLGTAAQNKEFSSPKVRSIGFKRTRGHTSLPRPR